MKNSYDHDWPLKQDDFFPYADCPLCYWTGRYLPTACIACAFCRPALWPAILTAEVILPAYCRHCFCLCPPAMCACLKDHWMDIESGCLLLVTVSLVAGSDALQ